jgi:hypothetical protein
LCLPLQNQWLRLLLRLLLPLLLPLRLPLPLRLLLPLLLPLRLPLLSRSLQIFKRHFRPYHQTLNSSRM